MTNALPVNGRATDSQFAQNPLPLAHAMGVALAELHGQRPAEELVPQTAAEVEGALNFLDGLDHDETPPAPFGRVRVSSVRQALNEPPLFGTPVHTHGSPITAVAVVIDSKVIYESAGTDGLDPPERDLAIVMRSISETWTSEVTTAFMDGYIDGGGELPSGPTLDWYGVVAAFR